MKITVLVVIFLLWSTPPLICQESKIIHLSLKRSLEQAVNKNIKITSAQIDKQMSAAKVEEIRSALFPQVEINGNFQNNVKLPTTMLPGEIIGQPGTTVPVQMGSQYNANASISFNQILYNQTVFTSLNISKQNEALKQLSIEKAIESLIQDVAKLYFLAQTTAEQKTLIGNNISRTQRIANITKILLDNGMAKVVDYDRINVSLQNMHTQLDNTEALHQQQLNMMKYMLQITQEENILLTDTINEPLIQAESFSLSNLSSHVDIRILESQKEISRLNHRAGKARYIPTLSFFAQYSYQGLRSEFKNYFNGSGENRWNNSFYIGLNVSIPVFDGFNKRSKLRQTKLEYAKNDLILNDTKQHFNVNYKNAINNYYNNKKNVERQYQNINLAEKVYKETALKYQEGLSSMSDLLQDEMSLNNAQLTYINSIYYFKEAELQIMSLNGEIKNLIKY